MTGLTIAMAWSASHNEAMGSAAASPSIVSGRRPFRLGLRFSLRTFLAAITIFCVLLGWRLHRAKMQREAARAIRDGAGRIHYDYERLDFLTGEIDAEARPWEPAWLLALVGIDFFHDVTDVSAPTDYGRGPAARIAPHLGRLSALRSIEVNLDEAEMRQIGRFRRLESFGLWNWWEVSDESVQELCQLPRLKHVRLGDSPVSDRSLALLARLPNLEVLELQGTRITDDGLAVLAGHPRLRGLGIGGSPRRKGSFSDAGLVHLARLPQLEELNLEFTRVTPAGLAALQKLPRLGRLNLRGSTADDYDLVAPLFPNCRVSAEQKTPAAAASPPGEPSMP